MVETQQMLNRSRRDGNNIWKNNISKIWITTMMWLVTQSQILDCEVQWALRSTAVNKTNGCNEIPAELFKPPKMMLSKCYIHCVSKSGRPSSGHKMGRGKSSSQFPRRVVPKDVLTIRQLHSSSMLVRSCLKSCMIGFSIMRTKTSRCPIWFRKGRGTRDQIVNIHWIIKKGKEFQKNIYLCFINYVKAFDSVDHDKLWKALREVGIPDHFTCLLRNLYAGQEATVRTLYGTADWFRIAKGA